MLSPADLRQAIKRSGLPVSQLAEQAGIAPTTLYSFMSGATGSLRASAHSAVETSLSAKRGGFDEGRAPFARDFLDLHPALLAEAKSHGLNVQDIANKAVDEAVKRARINAWVEENREAFADHARHVEEHGLWSDGLRAF